MGKMDSVKKYAPNKEQKKKVKTFFKNRKERMGCTFCKIVNSKFAGQACCMAGIAGCKLKEGAAAAGNILLDKINDKMERRRRKQYYCCNIL